MQASLQVSISSQKCMTGWSISWQYSFTYSILKVGLVIVVYLNNQKVAASATCLTFLGIEFDTVPLQIHLPSQKLFNLKLELSQAVSCKCITKRNLQSLVGLNLLQHGKKVICHGRAFSIQALCSTINWTLSFSLHSPQCSCTK